MKEFNCFKEYQKELKSEGELILQFQKFANEGDCVKLDVFNDLFFEFRKELLVRNENLFFIDNKPFSANIHLQPKIQEYPLRASQFSICTKQILFEYWDKIYDNKIPKNDNRNPAYDMAAKIGTLLHEILQRYLTLFGCVKFKDNKPMLEENIVDSKRKVTGHIDFIGNFKQIYDIPIDFIGEIKTTGANFREETNQFNMTYRKYNHKIDSIIKKGEPSPYHLTQGNLYMDIYGLDLELFYYEDRSTSEHVTILYKKDSEIIKWIDEKALSVNRYWKNKTLPKERKNNNKCRFCRFTEICKEIKSVKDIEKLL